MQGRYLRVISQSSSRFLARGLSTAATPEAAAQLTLNFTTPHTPIYVKKVVGTVILPGDAGEYGITAGHSPLISQLKPGVVSVIHTEVKFVNLSNLNPE
jgi:hypothetical protein